MKTNQNDKPGNRFVKGRKQEALDQIEGWVGGSRDELIKAGAAKVASQPPKNITEQKMLDSHLYDMSRQRFNFIVQCQWERKLFLEKQKRKTAVMRDLLRNVNLPASPEQPVSQMRSKTDHQTDKKERLKSLQESVYDKENRKSKTRYKTLDSYSLGADVFVTHNLSRSLGPNSVISATGNKNRSRDSHTFTTKTNSVTSYPMKRHQIWPLNDHRYTKLSDVLCDTYPKSIHLQSRKTRRSVDNVLY